MSSCTATRSRTRFNGPSRQRGKLFSTGSPTASCLLIQRAPYSTLPHELLAFGEGASCFGRTEANRVAPRPYGGLPHDHEKGRVGGLPILVSRFRGTRPGNPGESLKEDRPSTQRFVMVPAHASPKPPCGKFGASPSLEDRLSFSGDSSLALPAAPPPRHPKTPQIRPPQNNPFPKF